MMLTTDNAIHSESQAVAEIIKRLDAMPMTTTRVSNKLFLNMCSSVSAADGGLDRWYCDGMHYYDAIVENALSHCCAAPTSGNDEWQICRECKQYCEIVGVKK